MGQMLIYVAITGLAAVAVALGRIIVLGRRLPADTAEQYEDIQSTFDRTVPTGAVGLTVAVLAALGALLLRTTEREIAAERGDLHGEACLTMAQAALDSLPSNELAYGDSPDGGAIEVSAPRIMVRPAIDNARYGCDRRWGDSRTCADALHRLSPLVVKVEIRSQLDVAETFCR